MQSRFPGGEELGQCGAADVLHVRTAWWDTTLWHECPWHEGRDGWCPASSPCSRCGCPLLHPRSPRFRATTSCGRDLLPSLTCSGAGFTARTLCEWLLAWFSAGRTGLGRPEEPPGSGHYRTQMPTPSKFPHLHAAWVSHLIKQMMLCLICLCWLFLWNMHLIKRNTETCLFSRFMRKMRTPLKFPVVKQLSNGIPQCKHSIIQL